MFVFKEIPEVQLVGRIQEQIVETIKVVSQKRETQRISQDLRCREHELHVDQ